eukprot:TRINITY_DN39087_c0_g1_i1.p1 TRINITY_DN39087_c0_g1~~TRINITY_DN39087_c0_g1_i1.p1  ORF type:complete len:409 (+),score=95.40 TRINITY_DN39087_c0_g1_i1:65-1291(+)
MTKLFVGGLAGVTTEDSMTLAFSQFGHVTCEVMMDKFTGRSRGFGFATFSDPVAADSALLVPQVIDGKQVECKVCLEKGEAPPAVRPLGGGRSEAHSYEASMEAAYNASNRGGASELIANKLFVGGLPSQTTNESLQTYFNQFGECECIVMMDKMTGRNRGFGFATFTSAEQAKTALTYSPHAIDGKPVELRIAEAQTPKGQAPSMQEQFSPAAASGMSKGYGKGAAAAARSAEPGKLFIGGLPQTCTNETLQLFGQQFGIVADAKVMMDKGTGRSRGFGYLTFEQPQAVEIALANFANNQIDGKQVEVKRCDVPRDSTPQMAAPMAMGGGRGAAMMPGMMPVTHDQSAQQLVSLLTDPSLGLGAFIQPMLQQLQTAAAVTRGMGMQAAVPGVGFGKGGGKGKRSSPY